MVMLTAEPGYTFAGLATATINGKTAVIINNTDATVILSYQFPATLVVPVPTVTDVVIKTQPRLIYSDGDQLDLSSMEVTLSYSDNTTEDVRFTSFAAKRLTTTPVHGTTLSSLMHNNNAVEVTHSNNSAPIRVRTNNLTVLPKVNPIIAIDGLALKPILPNGKEFIYVSPECKEDDSIALEITQENARITINGTEQNTLTQKLSYEGDQIGIVVSSDPVGAFEQQEYALTVKKPFPAEKMIKTRWGNTLTVIGLPTDHDYDFATYKWYRNNREVGSGQSWSAGTNGEKLNPRDRYYVEATTRDGKTIRSCDIPVTSVTAQQEYGILLKNNSAYSNNIGIEVFAPEEASEVEITVYDIGGKQVFRQKGNYAFSWNLSDAMQRSVPNGLYFVTAKAKGESGKLYRYSAKLVVKR